MAYFKILLIILVALPVIAGGVFLFFSYSSYASDMNRRNAASRRGRRAGTDKDRRQRDRGAYDRTSAPEGRGSPGEGYRGSGGSAYSGSYDADRGRYSRRG